MLLIVEGIDRVGKTTLCKKLEEQLGFIVYKDPRFIDLNKENRDVASKVMADKMLSILYAIETLGMNKNIVLDRFHWTELVYGLVERNYKIKQIEMFKQIDKKAYELNAKLLYVEPIDIERSNKEHEKNLSTHNFFFNRIKRLSSLPIKELNYNEIMSKNAKQLIFSELLERSEENENSIV